MKNLNLALSFQDGTWFGILVDDEDRLVASAFADDKWKVEKHLAQNAKKSTARSPRHVEHRYVKEMVRLFSGHKSLAPVDLGLQNTTLHQKKVYSVLNKIPRGRVTSYGLIARAIGSGPRSVGQAVGSNPCPLFVPCHRVVPSDMTVGNYSIRRGLEHGSVVKRVLLEREGIRFQAERIPSASLWNP